MKIVSAPSCPDSQNRSVASKQSFLGLSIISSKLLKILCLAIYLQSSLKQLNAFPVHCLERKLSPKEITGETLTCITRMYRKNVSAYHAKYSMVPRGSRSFKCERPVEEADFRLSVPARLAP